MPVARNQSLTTVTKFETPSDASCIFIYVYSSTRFNRQLLFKLWIFWLCSQNKLIMELDYSPLIWLPKFFRKFCRRIQGYKKMETLILPKCLLVWNYPSVVITPPYPRPPSTIRPRFYITFPWKFVKTTKCLCWMCRFLYAVGSNFNSSKLLPLHLLITYSIRIVCRLQMLYNMQFPKHELYAYWYYN